MPLVTFIGPVSKLTTQTTWICIPRTSTAFTPAATISTARLSVQSRPVNSWRRRIHHDVRNGIGVSLSSWGNGVVALWPGGSDLAGEYVVPGKCYRPGGSDVPSECNRSGGYCMSGGHSCHPSRGLRRRSLQLLNLSTERGRTARVRRICNRTYVTWPSPGTPLVKFLRVVL